MEVESGGTMETPQGALFGDAIALWRQRTRRELGVSPNSEAPLTGAGHQPFLWHPGILAKFVHARVRGGPEAEVIHLVVDHDTFDPSIVRVPVLDASTLDAVSHRFGPANPAVTAMALPVFEPRRYEGPAPATASVAEGLDRAFEALTLARRDAANAPMQVAMALSSLMKRWVGPTRIIADSLLLGTTLGMAFIEAMRRDPGRCVEAFNRALALDPRAARPLRTGDDPELPLWTLRPSGRRERVTVSDLARASSDAHWLPRAFLLSAFMRLGVCDRFVHGTGARRYERVTEAWVREWLGIELPPIDIASATMRLPLLPDGVKRSHPITPDMRRAAWWNPESLDGERAEIRWEPGPTKRAMLGAIAALPRRSPERRAHYRLMLKELDGLRHERSRAFAELDARLAVDRARANALRLAHDRTWPFVYFSDESLDAAFSHMAD